MKRLTSIRRYRPLVIALTALVAVSTASLLPAVADEANQTAVDIDPEARTFFETRVRPVLADNCYECHGEVEQESDLRVDSLQGLLTGGEGYGPAIVPGAPGRSMLIDAVNHREIQMPPEKKLSNRDIEALTAWVKMGAPWPGASKDIVVDARKPDFEVTDEHRSWWSFLPIDRPNVPNNGLASGTNNAIDAFVYARLDFEGLTPSSVATRRELIRRATVDLLGLPPTPEEVRAFVADNSPDAYQRLIDRLLASPHYGERWGRHWLDLVRYAQTNGYERDDEKPYAWRYRDYVIRAFNQDKPFDQFVLEQLAGDELEQATDDSIIATAFYRFGVWDDEPDDITQAVFDGYDDMLTTTGSAFLGLSIGCARCHEHKFDPIPQEDYYRMLAFIRNVNYYLKPEKEQRKIVVVPLPSGEETLGVTERGAKPRPTHVLLRGRAATPAAEVEPRFPQVLCSSSSATVPEIPTARSASEQSTGRRLALAQWIANPKNPLTARVIVNRLWHYHFGRGIVATPSDFGKTGIPPTHPELLDWLATELIDGGWRLKSLHKKIMMSATYQQSSHPENSKATAADPENLLLWRQNARGLEAEAVRDAVLAVSGQLNPEAGGRGFFPRLPAQVVGSQSMPGRGWAYSDNRQRSRRSVYVYSKRSLQLPLLEMFDSASTEQSIARRSRTTVAPQALGLLNSQFVTDQAKAFASRLRAEAGEDLSARIRRAYWLTLGRDATDEELQIAFAYYQRSANRYRQTAKTWSLRPALPSALHETFLEKCDHRDFYDGPRTSWSYHRGEWPGRGDSIHWVKNSRGPVALYDDVAFTDGTVRCRLRLNRNAELAAIVFRAQSQKDLWLGYELYLDPRNGTAALKRLGDEVTTLVQASVPLIPDHWHTFRINATGGRIRVWLDEQRQPILDITDADPLLTAGKVGLRGWVAPLEFRDFFVRGKYQAIEVRGDPPDEPEERALAALGKLILNLNEFVYID